LLTEWFWKKLTLFIGWLTIAILFALIIFSANIEIKDQDLWLHLTTGRYILQNYIIPTSDIFSCTIGGKPWINHEWLFQTILAWVHGQFGFEGLINLQVIVVILTFSLLFLLGYSHNRFLLPTFLLLLVLLVYQVRFTIRPDIFSLLFFVVYFWVLALELPRRSSLIILGAVQILWTNTHGFFILGPLIVLLMIFGEVLKRRIPLPFQWNKAGRIGDAEFKRLLQILGVVTLACLVNPHFLEGALYPLRILSSLSQESKVFFENIIELQKPVTLKTLFSVDQFFAYKILIVLSFLSFFANFRKIDLTTLFFWIMFLVFSLNASRNVVFFAFAAYFVCLINFEEGLESFLVRWIKNPKVQSILLVILHVLLIMWMLQSFSTWSLRGYFDFTKMERKSEYGGISQHNYPSQAVDFILENHIQGRFFNNFNSGAYLIGRAYPSVQVYIDGRTEVYGPTFFKNYRKVMKGTIGDFNRINASYPLTGAFLSNIHNALPSNVMKYLYEDEEWILVYFDHDAAILLKDIEENKRWIDQFAIDLSQWQTEPADLLELGARNIAPYQHMRRAKALYNLKIFDKAREETEQAMRIGPHFTDIYKLMGKIYIGEKKFSEAYPFLRRAKIVSPWDLETRYYLAIAFYHSGVFDKAEKHCLKVLKHKPQHSKGLFLISMIYAKQKKYSQSFDTLKLAHTIEPKKIKEIIAVGDILSSQEAYDWAQRIYALGLEIDPENEELKKGLQNVIKEKDHE